MKEPHTINPILDLYSMALEFFFSHERQYEIGHKIKIFNSPHLPI